MKDGQQPMSTASATAPQLIRDRDQQRDQRDQQRSRRLKLHKPATSPIDKLAAKLSQHLYMPPSNLGALSILIGTLAANMIEGDPCWLIFVGPSSTGKSELTNLLLGVPGVFECTSPSGEQAFLSGTNKKEQAKDATGGLLRMVGTHGALLMNDITSILSKKDEVAKQILSVFRECHSGRWVRQIGGDGGRNLYWEGKLAVIGGCTGVIDGYHKIIAPMGERWLYYRLADDPAARWAKGKMALSNASKGGWREVVRSEVALFFSTLELEFGKLQTRRSLTEAEDARILRMAGVIARCRSTVSREGYTHDIVVPPELESESRISTSLSQLLVGMEVIGVSEEKRWELIGKTAMDSMPAARRLLLETIREKGSEGATIDELVGCTKMTLAPIERIVQELEIHGCVVRAHNPEGKRTRYQLSDWLREEWRIGWGE